MLVGRMFKDFLRRNMDGQNGQLTNYIIDLEEVFGW